MKKRINWKVRLANPTFIIQCIIAVGSPVLVYMGLNFQDLTTWGTLWDVICKAFSNPALLVMAAYSLYVTITDPTTKGSADDQAVLEEKPENTTLLLELVEKVMKDKDEVKEEVVEDNREVVKADDEVVPELVEVEEPAETPTAKNPEE